MKIKSIFKNNEEIPEKYTEDGENINPVIKIEDIPEQTESLVLIVDDPDAPAKVWVHWVVFNISAKTKVIKENSVPGEQGKNDFGKNKYGGPSPPSGTHRYFFKVYALDTKLYLDNQATKHDVEKEMQGHILGKAELIGVYSRKPKFRE